MPKYKSPSSKANWRRHALARSDIKNHQVPINSSASHKAHLKSKFGLPPDTKFLFFKKGQDFERPPTPLHFGTVVCLDKETSELLLVAQFNSPSSQDKDLIDKFENAISTLYQHGKARYKVKNNGAVKKAKVLSQQDGGPTKGKMYAVGFRPGYEKDFKAGLYALNANTSDSFQKMKEDVERQKKLPQIEDFISERFARLSLYAYRSNAEIALQTGAPPWSATNFYASPNAQVFASNLVVTCDNFHTTPHSDNDASKFAFGLSSHIKRDTGELYFPGDIGAQGKVLGAKFMFDEYNFHVDYDRCDGVVELLWNTKAIHQTSPSQTYDSNGRSIPAEDSAITLFASAFQITQALVDRLGLVSKLKGDMNDSDWEKHLPNLITGYGHELRKKMKKLAKKLKIDTVPD